MFFRKIESPGIAHFSYMLGEADAIAVIDPVRDVEVYMQEARKAGMKIRYILETHRNEDYVSGSLELGEKTGATIYISGHEDLGHVYGERIENGFELKLGRLRLRALHTPGHTLGHLSYVLYEKDRASPYMVFTGDCLFMGDVGRTDFYGEENLQKMTELLYESIFQKLLPLGDEVMMFPAHGAGSACGESMDSRPYSSLGYERKYNKALQYSSKEDFIREFARRRIKPRYFEKMEELNVKGAPFVGNTTFLGACTMEEVEKSGEKISLIDIRTKEAYFGGHLPASIYLSKNTISTFLGSIFPTDERIVFLTEDNTNELEEIYWQCRRIGFDKILGFVPQASSQWESSGKELKKTATISAKDFLDKTKQDDFILLDVRKEFEIKKDDPHKNRINIPLQNLYKCLDQLEKDIPIYILCGTAERSTIAYSYLKPRGFTPLVISGGTDMIDGLKKD